MVEHVLGLGQTPLLCVMVDKIEQLKRAFFFAIDDSTRKLVLDEGGTSTVMNAMRNHPDPELQESACRALACLSFEGKRKLICAACQCVQMYVCARISFVHTKHLFVFVCDFGALTMLSLIKNP